MPLRFLVGAILAAGIAFLARRLGSLDDSGAAAAIAIGTTSVAAGWDWGALLLLYFTASSALSRWRQSLKVERTRSIVAKGGPRDAWQVLANGGVFALAAIASLAMPGADPIWRAAGIGALAASAADTWGTEIGSAIGGAPRSILTGRRLAPGTSGGITLLGMVATVAGAAFIAALVMLRDGKSAGVLAALVGGVGGALADSLLGAAAQERRHCPSCDVLTERLVHGCGAPTRLAGGVAGFRNDAVNLVASLVGGAVGVAVALTGIR